MIFQLYLRSTGHITCTSVIVMIDQINFGAFAAIFTTTAFLPQAFKVIRTRDTRSLSLSMYLLMLTGTTLWTFHGVHLNDKAIIYSNIITSALNMIILTMKIQELLKEKKRS